MTFKNCPGCGAAFQTDRPDDPGYLPANLDVQADTICRRCFRLRHYGQGGKAPINDASLTPSIKEAARRATTVFLVVDALRADEGLGALEWLSNLRCPVLLLATKADLLDDLIGREELTRWIAERNGLSSEQVVVLSGLKNADVRQLRLRIEASFGPGDRLLFLGRTNAGKSTLLASLLRGAGPTVSPLPGTTVGLTEYRTTDGLILVDAPGFKADDPLLSRLCPNCLMALTPRKRLTLVDTPLRNGGALCFGGLAVLKVVDGGERGWLRIGAFAPEGLTLHRTTATKAQELIDQRRDDLLFPPCGPCYDTLSRHTWNEEEFSVYPGLDVALPGLGWLTIWSGHGRLVLKAPSFMQGYTRPWLIPPIDRRRY